MSCAIVSGYTKDCRDSMGGLKTIYITELANKSSITSASGNITAFTLTSGKKFWTFEIDKFTSNFNQVPKPNAPNGSFYVEQTLNFKLPKFSATTAYQIKNLAVQDLMIIALTMNGDYILLGETNGMQMQDSSQPSGTAMADFSGFDLTFKADEPDMAKTVASNLIATLTVPA